MSPYTRKRQKKKATTRRKETHRGGKRQLFSSPSFDHVIAYLQDYTAGQSKEICGTIAKEKMPQHHPNRQYSKNIYVAYVHEVTPPLGTDERPHCLYEHVKDYVIWHNHPATSKFYPSWEDIVKGLKPKNQHISESYLFSEFGVWKIQYWDHSGVTTKEIKQLRDILNALYHTSQRGRVYNVITNYYVDQMIMAINDMFPDRLTIQFLGSPYY